MIIRVNSVNKLMFVMVKCGVLFEVRPLSLNIIYMSFGFKGLRETHTAVYTKVEDPRSIYLPCIQIQTF
jgi:hypothetical protein